VNIIEKKIFLVIGEYHRRNISGLFVVYSSMFSSLLSVIMTLVSIVLFCVETLPVFATSHCEHDELPNTSHCEHDVLPNFADPFFVIETVCTAWFTLEILIRLAGCPSKLDFCKDVKNLVDVGAILPYYVTLINVLLTMSCEGAKSSASLAFLRVTRLRCAWYTNSLFTEGCCGSLIVYQTNQYMMFVADEVLTLP